RFSSTLSFPPISIPVGAGFSGVGRLFSFPVYFVFVFFVFSKSQDDSQSSSLDVESSMVHLPPLLWSELFSD
ncbi:unnamed protein product, partial [Arabidopsis halleri]